MIVTSTWTQIATGGVVIQKHGTKPLQLAYSASAPTGGNVFAVVGNESQVYPAGTNPLWAKTPAGEITISVEDLT